MWNRLIPFFVACLLAVGSLSSCKKSKEHHLKKVKDESNEKAVVVRDKDYPIDFRMVLKNLKSLDSMVHAEKISKQKYLTIVFDKGVEVEKVLKKYQADPLSQQESYRYAKAVLHHYQVAETFWKENKGLSLIGARWELARNDLEKFEAAFNQETGPEEK